MSKLIRLELKASQKPDFKRRLLRLPQVEKTELGIVVRRQKITIGERGAVMGAKRFAKILQSQCPKCGVYFEHYKWEKKKFCSWVCCYEKDEASRFWIKVDKNGDVPKHAKHLGRCWNWIAGRGSMGRYGSFCVRGKMEQAHRVSWVLTEGKEIPEDMKVLHKCDNGFCVNPSHLFLGSQKENVNDMLSKGRGNPSKGESHPKARIKAIQVIEIRRRCASGERQKDLAVEFGTDPSCISAIFLRRNWKSI